MPGMPGGGMPGFGDPDLESLLSDPDVAAALEDAMTNPANLMKHMSNPKVAKALGKLQGMFGKPSSFIVNHTHFQVERCPDSQVASPEALASRELVDSLAEADAPMLVVVVVLDVVAAVPRLLRRLPNPTWTKVVPPFLSKISPLCPPFYPLISK